MTGSARRHTSGPVVVDLRAVQTPDSRGRGISRYAYEFTAALERHRPDLVCRYLLAPDWPPPGDINRLTQTGKVMYAGTPGSLPDCARVYHTLSPFELAVPTTAIWPAEVEHHGLSFSATVYDLIPLRHRDLYLSDARQRSRYQARCEVLRLADALLAISRETKADVVDLLSVEASAITVVGSGRPHGMARPQDVSVAVATARSLDPGLEERFILYPGGSDARKNVDGLISAYGLLPAGLRATYQLVVCCDLPELAANHYRHLASSLGVGDHLLMPGYVSDLALEALYQSAAVMCFPSLAEGFCLPIAEAMACGAVVVASDIAPLDELVPPEARFDPADAASIAHVLGRALTDERFRQANRAHGTAGTWSQPWEDVVERSAKVFEDLASRPRKMWRRGARIALVAPFPPIHSGVATHSARLAHALRTRLSAVAPDSTVDCYADGLDRSPAEPVVGGSGEWFDARRFFLTQAAVGGYERVIYVLGNSEFHSGALAALRRTRGVVIAHEVRLTNLLRFSSIARGTVPGGLEGAIRHGYGAALPLGLGKGEILSVADLERFGLLLLREVVGDTDTVFVSSEAALRLAEVDVGPSYASRLAVLPFAIAMPDDELAVVAEGRAERRDGRALVASFGIVDPAKLPHLVVEAVAQLEDESIDLALIGPVSEALEGELVALATRLGIGERTLVTGRVSRDEYLRYLGRATVAVQLRSDFGGEASGAVGDCLAAGVPTVVADIGWMGDLPDDCVRKFDAFAGASELADEIAGLIRLPDRRARLSERGAAYASRHTFEETAAALVRALGLG